MGEKLSFLNKIGLGQLQRVMEFAAPYKNRVFLSVILAVVLAALSPVRPYLIQITINDYIREGQAPDIRQTLINIVIWITVIQIGLLLLESALRFYFSYITAWLGQAVVKDLRVKVFGKILSLNLRQFDRTPIGTLTTRTINDIESVNNIFSEGLIPIIADLLSIIAVLIYMFVTDWQLTLISLAPFPFLILATYFFKESVNKSFIQVRNAVARLNAFVQEHLTGIAVVQAFSVEEKETKKFREINKDHRNANIRAIFAYSVFFPIVEIVLAVGVGLMVWWAGTAAFNMEGAAAQELLGKMMAFYLCLNLLFRPLRVIADKFNVLQMGMVASERVFKVLDNQDYIKNTGHIIPETTSGKVEFKNVTFGYIEGQDVLKNINFIAQPGETVALVGHTGSGKTSVISLMNRLYQINEGKILIDDVDINDYELQALRRSIGVVLQDVFLFSGSVLENITLRDKNISREQVIEAAKMIDMHDFIIQLPGGYDYNVMERGGTLSLGQRQLISFIRAILYNPSILILDEATSSIDTESEQLIQKAIDTLIKGRTSIVIAHRLSTIRKANKIIVLDKGEIIEMGTHDQLLKQKGHYFNLHQMQFEKKKPVSVR